MILDGRTVEPGARLATDLCIIGGGPAGVTVARAFEGSNVSVCLLESGGFEDDAASQALNRGIDEGTIARADHLFMSRRRRFGGTTAVWGGWCRPLDDIDFEARDWVPHSGWPFGRETLAPYYDRAATVLRIDPLDRDTGDFEGVPGTNPLEKHPDVVTRVFQASPTEHGRFGEIHRDALKTSANIRLIFFANAVDLETDEHAKAVTAIKVASLGGRHFVVTPKVVVLAMGGIENPRLLLLSNRVQGQGLGNGHDVVGRYYMEHPWIYNAGRIVLVNTPRVARAFKVENSDVWRFQALGLSEATQRRLKLMNFRAYLKGVPGSAGDTVDQAIGRAATHLAHAAGRKVATDGMARQYFQMDVSSEQAPDPDSRVTLAEARDAFGNRMARLDWRLSALDRRTIRRSMAVIASGLGRELSGRMKNGVGNLEPWPERTAGGHHHMGGTRIHEDPKRGVVDAQCRVHGVANLFVAGSSVFPTVGFANPTFTIVALAARLADHLKAILRHGNTFP